MAELVHDEYHKVRVATLDDVEPMKEVLRKDPLKENTFIKTFFYPEVDWQTVVELVNANLIYVKDQSTDLSSPTKEVQATIF